ncbi:hemolysin III family protein [Anaerococcus porci]|uniref:PAQR family membrane homeostasis protein TrhA n=1 Tax=Anaerococcus porci TaxID=2652269 RepID=UPI002A75C62B|nr:hemolysin III family protein [Anaerococcus porci]MDY3006510.1 hemolysin III family protein [Anaerococcus porci]
MRIIQYKKSEEITNIVSHAIGFILTLICFLPIIISAFKEEDYLKAVAFLIYMISIGLMFLSSTLYHSMTNPKLRTVFRAIDHGVIYLTIAGSYTPIILIGLRSVLSLVIFVAVWILAIAGILMNIIAFSKAKEEKISKISMIIYIIMGWLSLILFYQIIKHIGIGYLLYMILGGIFYTVGAYFYSNKKIKYNHAIWHIFILIATFTMFYGNYVYLA